MKQKLTCVLLIDDDEPTNFLSRMLFEEADCTVHIQVENSGKKALNYLSSIRQSLSESILPAPNLILLDINMPAMDGWEFLDKYKELEKRQGAKIIIIMLTTSLNPDDKIKAESIPEVSGFENKPLTSEMIDRVIKKYFDNANHSATGNYIQDPATINQE
jgi:CheY-like chemotaxis protein